MGLNINLEIDFLAPKLLYRIKRLNGRNELIAKAIGYRASSPLTIIDATAGMGKDAFLLAALGCQVTLFERNASMSSLLRAALRRGSDNLQTAPIISRMKLIESCFIEYFLNRDDAEKPDLVYCDPMFEFSNNSASSKKEITTLKKLIGPDEDACELVKTALTLATKRVVVKRRLHAPPLYTSPDFSIAGRSHRFDVYMIKGR